MGKDHEVIKGIFYDYSAGRRLFFDLDLEILKGNPGDLVVAYYARPSCQMSVGEASRYVRGRAGDTDPKAQMAVMTDCGLDYFLSSLDGPINGSIGTFRNKVSLDLDLNRQLEAGDVTTHVFHQIALRLAVIYDALRGRDVRIRMSKDKEPVPVTPTVIDAMKWTGLPEEIAFLQDEPREYRPGPTLREITQSRC